MLYEEPRRTENDCGFAAIEGSSDFVIPCGVSSECCATANFLEPASWGVRSAALLRVARHTSSYWRESLVRRGSSTLRAVSREWVKQQGQRTSSDSYGPEPSSILVACPGWYQLREVSFNAAIGFAPTCGPSTLRLLPLA